MRLLKYELKNNLFITFYLLHYLRFFNLRPYVQLGSLLVVIDVAFCSYFFFCFIKTWKRCEQKSSILYFGGMYLMAIISIFIANFESGQSLYYGLRGFAHSYLQLGFIFYLVYKKYEPLDLLKICLLFAFAHSLSLLLAYVQYPNNILGFQASVDEDYIERAFETRGVFRFNMPGGDFVVFALLYVLGAFRKIKGKSYILFGLIILILLRGVRSCIIASAITGLLTYLFSKKINFKRICLILIFPIVGYTLLMSIPFTKNIVNSYLSLTEEQYEANKTDDDIRLQNIYYFSMVFNDQNSVLPNIVGNGPIVDGPVAKKLDMASQVGFWLSDVEYITWFIYFGIIGLLIVILWGISCMIAKIPRDYYYFKMMLLYYFIVMTFGAIIMDNIPIVCILTYVIYIKSLQKNGIETK